MAKINPRDFVGTRCRLQRLRDAKVLNGWIEDFLSASVDVATASELHLRVGEEFRFEGFGHHISVVFNGRLTEVKEQVDWESLTAGGNARALEAGKTSMRLAVTGPVRYSASPESVRMLCPEMPIRIAFGANEIHGTTVDVGANGVGVVATQEVDPGTTVAAFIDTPHGRVAAQALVRYCRSHSSRDGFCRIGLMFTDMGRVDRPRWDRFLQDLS
jgi:hypothetical protein